MIVDPNRRAIPFGSAVLEVADQFAFLAVDADDGKPCRSKRARSEEICWNCSSRYGLELVAICFRLTRREKSIWYSKRETVLAETGISICCRSSAIFSVVLRVHFNPVMGSPAVSCSRIISMASIISGVFFPPAGARRPFCGHGPPSRPAPTTAVFRAPRCEDRGRGRRPGCDHRRGPA